MMSNYYGNVNNKIIPNNKKTYQVKYFNLQKCYERFQNMKAAG